MIKLVWHVLCYRHQSCFQSFVILYSIWMNITFYGPLSTLVTAFPLEQLYKNVLVLILRTLTQIADDPHRNCSNLCTSLLSAQRFPLLRPQKHLQLLIFE